MPAVPKRPQLPKRPELSGGAALAVRIAWLICALFWTAFAVLEAINHGWPALAAVVAFFVLPDLTFLIGLSHAPDMAKGQLPPPAVPYYNAVHRVWVPFALLLLYTVVPGQWPPVFAALCGWLAHLAWDRTFGFALRDGEGFQRA